MKIGIIGLGFVGLSFASVLASKGYNVIGIETDVEKLKTIRSGKSYFYEPRLDEILQKAIKKKLTLSENVNDVIKNCELIFVTVGTPMTSDGSINLGIIFNVCEQIGNSLSKTENVPMIIIKSTVIPGTTKQIKEILEKKSGKKTGLDFGLLTNPEFLREGRAVEDTLYPHLIVIGTENKKHGLKLKNFYNRFYQNSIPVMITNDTTAELIKYANNSFLATKISFINNIANLCQTLPGTNIDDIAKAIGIDPRIGRQFLNAGPGYGGSCLPKDIQAMIRYLDNIGEDSTLLKAVHKTNVTQVEKILKLIEKCTGDIKGKKITVLGLSFKEESDDIRESVSIKLIEELLKRKSHVRVHDPKALENTRNIFKERILYFDKIADSLKNSQCVILMTPWKQYSKLENSDFQGMDKKIIIDTRRILNLEKKDLTYIGLGIGE